MSKSSHAILGLITILFTLKGLGGSFNSTFVLFGIPQFHGPFVGGVIAVLMIIFILKVALGNGK